MFNIKCDPLLDSSPKSLQLVLLSSIIWKECICSKGIAHILQVCQYIGCVPSSIKYLAAHFKSSICLESCFLLEHCSKNSSAVLLKIYMGVGGWYFFFYWLQFSVIVTPLISCSVWKFLGNNFIDLRTYGSSLMFKETAWKTHVFHLIAVHLLWTGLGWDAEELGPAEPVSVLTALEKSGSF